MKKAYGVMTVALVAFANPTGLEAQKGTGSATGVAREQVKPALETLSGTVTSIKTGACEKTTGRAVNGTHLLLQTPDKKEVNLHLGPSLADEVKQVLQSVKSGSHVEAVAFHTSRLPADQLIAKSVTVEGKTLQLRDENLRPTWAGTFKGSGGGKGTGPCF